MLRFLLWRMLAVLAILTSYTLVGWFVHGGPGRLLRGSAVPSPTVGLAALASAPLGAAHAAVGSEPRPLLLVSVLLLAPIALAVARCLARRRRRYVRMTVNAYRTDSAAAEALVSMYDVVQFLDAPGGARGDDSEGPDTGGELDAEALAGVGAEELEVTF